MRNPLIEYLYWEAVRIMTEFYALITGIEMGSQKLSIFNRHMLFLFTMIMLICLLWLWERLKNENHMLRWWQALLSGVLWDISILLSLPVFSKHRSSVGSSMEDLGYSILPLIFFGFGIVLWDFIYFRFGLKRAKYINILLIVLNTLIVLMLNYIDAYILF